MQQDARRTGLPLRILLLFEQRGESQQHLGNPLPVLFAQWREPIVVEAGQKVVFIDLRRGCEYLDFPRAIILRSCGSSIGNGRLEVNDVDRTRSVLPPSNREMSSLQPVAFGRQSSLAQFRTGRSAARWRAPYGRRQGQLRKGCRGCLALSLGKPVIFLCDEERRKRFFGEVHPLNRLIEFQTGVAVGAMVTSEVEQVAILLGRIFENKMEYALEQPKRGYFQLRERITSSTDCPKNRKNQFQTAMPFFSFIREKLSKT
jgi:hypothetical protein